MGEVAVNHHLSSMFTHHPAFSHFQLSHPFNKHVSIKNDGFSCLALGVTVFLVSYITVSLGPTTVLIWEIWKGDYRERAFCVLGERCQVAGNAAFPSVSSSSLLCQPIASD